MPYDVLQALGEHEVTVEAVDLIDKDGDGANLVFGVCVKFKNGELGLKDLYPCKSDKSLAIARKSLKAMGFDIDKRSVDEIQGNRTLLAGAKVRVTVEENVYNGKVTNRIAWINPIPKAAGKKAVDSLTQALRNVKTENAENEL